MLKVTIFDIKRFAVHDGPGIRTTVFMKGCPLRCWWCHNPESQSPEPFTVDIDRKVNGRMVQLKKTYGEELEVGEVMNIILRDIMFYQESEGGVTFSGGEPLMQPDALEELLRLSRKNGLHTAVDTSGFARRELFERILPLTDLFLYDLKHMDPGMHKHYTGVDNSLIHSNVDHLLERGARVIFRIPVIPGINTVPEEVDRMVRFVADRRSFLEELHLLPYHRLAENKYFRLRMKNNLPEIATPDKKMMDHLLNAFSDTGLTVREGG